MTSFIPNEHYPDPSIKILDPSFLQYRVFSAGVEQLYTGTRWGEGPVWFGDGRYLLWSDIPNDRILRWDECSGQTSIFRQSSRMANGNTRDRQGRLITCEHVGRQVTRTEYDGTQTILADRFEGKRLNSPNDVVVKSDGSIWFTDPPFGIQSNYEGVKAEQELPACVYRIDPQTGALRVVADGIEGPNGLCFSPDESLLYVVESRSQPHRRIRVFEVKGGDHLGKDRVFVDAGPNGTPDGMRCDVDGNIWAGWGLSLIHI